MYYRGVNRGLSFTKPGFYALGLILLIGMIAVTTGINGLYVFLSVGLGGFIISGLLSEKAMRSCSIQAVQAPLVDADTAFTIDFSVHNSSSWFSVFALHNIFMTQAPRLRILGKPPTGVAELMVARVPPASQVTYGALCPGLARGVYKSLLLMQRTTFPFGILDKFKIVEVPTVLSVAPRLDRHWRQEFQRLLQAHRQAQQAEQEFYCHRPYRARDALQSLDWKKNAKRAPRDWVVKQLRAPHASLPLCLDASWESLAALSDAALYEQCLRQLRTALAVLREQHRHYLVDFGQGCVLQDEHYILQTLAAAPRFAERSQGLGARANAKLSGREQRILIRPGSPAAIAARAQSNSPAAMSPAAAPTNRNHNQVVAVGQSGD